MQIELGKASNQTEKPFWERIPLAEMSEDQWESLCDGCGRCCLHKLENEETGEIFNTQVSCKLLSTETARCSQYQDRKLFVPDCITLKPENIGSFGFLPETCAYRLLEEGKPLYSWHPLVSGDPETVHQEGISVRGKCTREKPGMDLEDYIIDS